MQLLIRASDQQKIITMTTSMDMIPAQGKANTCLHLCSFTESLTNGCFNQKDIQCLFSKKSWGDISGVGQVGQPLSSVIFYLWHPESSLQACCLLDFLSFFKIFFWCGPFWNFYWICCNTVSILCFVFFFGCQACRNFAPQPGIEPTPLITEGEVLTTGPPGKSQE